MQDNSTHTEISGHINELKPLTLKNTEFLFWVLENYLKMLVKRSDCKKCVEIKN